MKKNKDGWLQKVGRRVAEAMKNYKTDSGEPLTQGQLAKKVGCSRPTIGHLIQGDRAVGLDTVTQVADALEVDPAAFFDSRKIVKSKGGKARDVAGENMREMLDDLLASDDRDTLMAVRTFLVSWTKSSSRR